MERDQPPSEAGCRALAAGPPLLGRTEDAPELADPDVEVDEFVAWFNNPPANLEALLRAGIAHLWLK